MFFLKIINSKYTFCDDFDFSSLKKLYLFDNEVHVWCALCVQERSHIDELALALSGNEHLTAKQYFFQKDQEHFVIAHGILRKMLGKYLNIQTNQVKFYYGANGKPLVKEMVDGKSLSFNMSYSQGLILYAFTWDRRIGVDIEHISPMSDAEEISQRFFSHHENISLRTIPKSERLEAFYNCWTRKEAFLKATGEGLSRSLDSFDVSLVPGEPAQLIYVKGDPLEASRWSLWSLITVPDFVGTLAVEKIDISS